MLKSLVIKNYRGLEDFQVEKLGRVNLIVGKNNSGKSTVLEALRLYAASGHRSVLEQIAADHDERFFLTDEDAEDLEQPFEHLFTGRGFPEDGTAIEIGEQGSSQALMIRHVYILEHEEQTVAPDGSDIVRRRRRAVPPIQVADDEFDTVVSQGLQLRKSRHAVELPFERTNGAIGSRIRIPELPDTLPCSYIPTRFVDMDELAVEWDQVALTDHEKTLKDVLRIIAPDFKDLAFVSKDDRYGRRDYASSRLRQRQVQRTAKVRLQGVDKPVSLNSMGDGMLRLLQLVLKMFPARGGLLLIDEFENGLHYSVQKQVWDLVFELAERLDIQVFATTHSWDCIQTFARAALDRPDIEGVLFRVGKSARMSDFGKTIATVFDEDRLYQITEADIEVR
ncbi:MAG: AAA family ATPase [Gammaproteobacteria bacterium]|nr:AAA family ATPase [Gammaproteobacteria bacterium]